MGLMGGKVSFYLVNISLEVPVSFKGMCRMWLAWLFVNQLQSNDVGG